MADLSTTPRFFLFHSIPEEIEKYSSKIPENIMNHMDDDDFERLIEKLDTI